MTTTKSGNQDLDVCFRDPKLTSNFCFRSISKWKGRRRSRNCICKFTILYIFAILESLQCLTFLFFQKYLERQISYWIRLSLVTQVAVTTILASHFTAALGAADALHFLSFSLVFYPLRVCWWWQITDTYHKIVLPAMYLTSIAPKWLYVANWEEEGLELCQVTRRRLSRILQ